MRVLVMTRLFPNAIEPLWSPFNRQQFVALAQLCDVEVLGTIPWFPGARALRRWSAAGRLADVPARENIDGVDVAHPRYLFAPQLEAASASLYAASLLPALYKRRRQIDLVLATWAYPDGAAAVMLAEALRVPAVVKVHGPDLDGLARRPSVRAHLRALLPRAARLVAVSRSLAHQLTALGGARERVAVVPNGVNSELFHPRDRSFARAVLGRHPEGKMLLYVGRLEREKGVRDLLQAFSVLHAADPKLSLVLVGDGAARGECEAEARRFGDAVLFTGERAHAEVALWLAACDLFVLPSFAEGSSNALGEALASGRRAVATAVGGIPELVHSPALGELVPPHQPTALAAAIARQLAQDYDADEVARSGRRCGWAESAACLKAVLEEAVSARPQPSSYRRA
jgi:glycosyltransferase involved in cell wall biosynthesis